MRLFRHELIFCVLCCSAACARPTLDEEGDGGDVVEPNEEAGAIVGDKDATTAAPPDASLPVVTTPDAAAEDAAAPALMTPPDAGANSDAGETLPTALFSCAQGAPQTSTSIDGSPVEGMVINGRPGTQATVRTGATVDITLQVTVDCGNFGAPSLRLGLAGEPDACRPGLCSGGFTLPFAFRFTAPAVEGWYPVLAALGSSPICTGSSSSQQTNIAALCVTH
ncbi:MAG: hypothetical protein JWN48_3024 [Myxococcaceae bacterium]|nr:hypothetical protein [Myxococcaceae bacterium]